MEDIIIYSVVIIASIFFASKLFGKNGSCGCGSKGKCKSKES